MTAVSTSWTPERPLIRKLRKLYQRSHQARWAMISQVITSGANFATTVLLVRAMGLEDFGRFSVCFLLTMVVRNFLNGVVLMPMSTIGPKLRPVSAPAYRGFLAANVVVFATVSSAILWSLARPLGWLIDAPWLPMLAVPLVVTNLTAVAADYVRRFHFVYHAPATACGVDAARFSVQLSLLCAIAYGTTHELTPSLALYCLCGGGGAGLIFGMVFHGKTGWSNRLAQNVWRRHWNFIKWMTPGVLFDTIQHNAPLFLSNALLGETVVGLIRAMQQLANVLNLPLNALQQTAPSQAASAFNTGGSAALKRFLVIMTAASMSFLTMVALGTFALSPIVVGSVFKVAISEANPILFSYFLVNLLILLRLPLLVGMQSVERPSIITFASLAGSVASVVFSISLIRLVGGQGAPLAAMAALACNIAVYMVLHAATRRPASRK